MVVQTSISDKQTAQQLANRAVELRLAACVQLLGQGQSYYRWQDQLEQASEYYLTFKTTTERHSQLIDWLTEQHPYDVPEIIWQAHAASESYVRWLQEATT